MHESAQRGLGRSWLWLLVAGVLACDADPQSSGSDGEADALADVAPMDAAAQPSPDGAAPIEDAARVDDLGGNTMPDAAVDAGGDTSSRPQSCEAVCERVADCLIDLCDGFAAGARGQLYDRCVERCSPEQAEALGAASCEALVESIGAQLPAVEAACRPPGDGEGLDALYIGHSFGRAFASSMPEWTRAAGVENHTQRVVMRGGARGAPQALWDDDGARSEVQGILDGGDVELLTMICCSESFLVDGSDPGIRLWMDYALERNPDTRFALAMPWPDFPAEYPNAEDYAARWNLGHQLWHALIDQLRADYPGVEIFCIPHGRAALELRALFEVGELRDVDVMTSGDGDAIFSDAKGHADRIMLDLGTLVWVGATYGVDLTGYPLELPYEADLVGLAQRIIAEDDHTR